MENIHYIPHIIHQMWFDKDPQKSHDTELPSELFKYNSYILTWKEHHPNFIYSWWNADRIKKMWEDPRLKRWRKFFYEGLQQHIEKCDYSRYAILYLYGGLYVDLDFTCLKPITSLFCGREFFFVNESSLHSGDIDEGRPRVSNAIMGSSPNHRIWPLLLDYIKENYTSSSHILLNTGPTILSKFIETYNIRKYPNSFVDTCLLLPLCGVEGGYKLDPKCRSLTDAYAYTKWFEGSGWGGQSGSTGSDRHWFLFLIIIVIIIIIVINFRSILRVLQC